VLLKGFVSLLGIDSGLFCIGNIIKSHPDQLISVTSQNPDVYGLGFDPTKYKIKKKSSHLNIFIEPVMGILK